MAIQEILETQAAKTVEIEILKIITEAELSKRSTYSKPAIQHLLHVRKKILDSMFVLTDEYKQRLYEFNESMKYAFCDMRRQIIDMKKSSHRCRLHKYGSDG